MTRSTFNIRNTATASGAYNYTVTCPAPVTTCSITSPAGGGLSGSTGQLAPTARFPVTVAYTAKPTPNLPGTLRLVAISTITATAKDMGQLTISNHSGQPVPYAMPYPLYPNASNGLDYQTPLDVANFTYDPQTNDLLTVNNVDGYVTRTYYPNGSLQTETQQIANLARTDFVTHTYQLQYTYDLGGRRRDLIHPTSLRTGAVRDRTSWAYDPVTGALQSVTDVMGNTVSYGYYDDGSIANATRGNSGAILETMIYDGDGRLLYNDVSRSGSSAPEKPWGS